MSGRMAQEVIDSPIEKEMQSSYLDYAMSVIIGRALPDARDGLKPAQRRTLYAMQQLGNTHDKPTVKSARVVGTVIGRYHPHGDLAAYDTLVRMAQDFSMNHTLVEGQGNMGSIDGDPPAAQRYTEVRLTRLAEEMLADLDKKAVPFVPNFDNTEEEPVVLPSKIPNLLVNGAAGIAVGVATNILQHNLGEVCDAVIAYVDKRDITPQELMQLIKGPDFPTGGTVFYNQALASSYLAGKGSCTIRGKTVREDRGDRAVIVVTEIPYGVNKASLVQKIAELVKDKVLTGVSDLRDESGKEGIRIVVELKRDANPDAVLNALFKHTQLQMTVPVMNIAVMGNSLMTMNIRQFIKAFVDHRIEVIKNRTGYDLQVASDRLHIVDGLLTAIGDIDAVVAMIRSSKDAGEARARLTERYKLSEKQTTAILEMKLSRLTSLESGSLKSEREDLVQRIKSYSDVLADETRVYAIVREETIDVKKRYARPRKTVLEQREGVELVEPEELISDTDAMVILTRNNYVKRMALEAFKLQSRGGKGVISIGLNEDDYAKGLVSCRLKDYLLVISTLGRLYWLKAYVVPEAQRYGYGKAMVNLVKLHDGEGVAVIANTREFAGRNLVFVTKRGNIKRVDAARFSKPRSNGTTAMPLRQGDALADALLTDGASDVLIATRNGRAIRFGEKEVRLSGRLAHGVRGVRLVGDDSVVNAVAAKSGDMILSVTERGFGKATPIESYRVAHRGGKGVINMRIRDKNGKVVKVLKAHKDSNVVLINSRGVSIMFGIDDVRITGRAAAGVRLMRVDASTRLVDAQVLPKQQGA